jgi:hypothetical protein
MMGMAMPDRSGDAASWTPVPPSPERRAAMDGSNTAPRESRPGPARVAIQVRMGRAALNGIGALRLDADWAPMG